MKALAPIKPTSEQLVLIADTRPGVRLIRGAAGSGKTSTALLMLRQLSSFWQKRKERLEISGNVQILMLTFNRTLRGYVQNLAQQQIESLPGVDLTVSTFGKLAKDFSPESVVLTDQERECKIKELAARIELPE